MQVASVAPTLAAVEADRKQQEELARAEDELKKQQELAKAEAERKRQEEIARAEAERTKLDALAKAEAERKRLEELARADAERKKKEDLARAETERKRQEELARAEAEVRKQQELAKAEADWKRYDELGRAEPATPAPNAPIQVASIGPNPFSKGTGRADTNYHVGDQYRYRTIDTLTQLETGQDRRRVTGVTDSEVIWNNGNLVTDRLGNRIKNSKAIQVDVTDQQIFVSEYSVGNKWTTRYRYAVATGEWRSAEIDFKVVGREIITVPAGTFDAYKVEGRGFTSFGSITQDTYWIAPDKVRQPIVYVHIASYRRLGDYFVTNRRELVSYRQSE